MSRQEGKIEATVLDPEQVSRLSRLKELLEEQKRRLEEDTLLNVMPTAKQWQAANSTARETCLSGGNQFGKSFILKIMAAYHLTGKYPPGWSGVRFNDETKNASGHDGPIVMAMGAVTSDNTKELLTDGLFGDEDDRGSGTIPREDIVRLDADRQITGGVRLAKIRHYDKNGIYDGDSKVYFFSYASGWRKVAGFTLHIIMIDEEPPFMVFDEFSARLNKTRGYLFIAMSPLDGVTALFKRFRDSKNSLVIYYGVDDATHLTEEHRQELRDKYRGHPYESARLHGRPCQEEGILYSIPNSEILVDPFQVSPFWPQIIGMDLPHTSGCFAAAKLAIDTSSDTWYLTNEVKIREASSLSKNVDALMGLGGMSIPIAYPHDGNRESESGTTTIAGLYKRYGLKLNKEFAHRVDGRGKKSLRVMPMIEEISIRMATGRFKVFANCEKFIKEKNDYRSGEGGIGVRKKQDDHVIDALHKAALDIRFAKAAMAAPQGGFRREAEIDDDLFSL